MAGKVLQWNWFLYLQTLPVPAEKPLFAFPIAGKKENKRKNKQIVTGPLINPVFARRNWEMIIQWCWVTPFVQVCHSD